MPIVSDKIKIVCIYQVIMHYRLPFYNKIATDNDIDFVLIHGQGLKNSKLKNTSLENSSFKRILLKDFRIPLPFSPLLFFHLVKENPDIVFSEGSSSLINGSISFLYAKLYRKKFIWWSLGALKGKEYHGFRKLINKWELYIEKHANAIFTYSTSGKKYFINRGVAKSNIFVAINVIDTNEKLNEINRTYEPDYLNKDDFNIGFIGTIQKTKNLEVLIDAINIIGESIKEIKLHIIGDGEYLTNIKKYAERNDNIIFYGRLNFGSAKILGNCEVLVLPGLGGLAICEGMLNKLAVITGNADGTEYDLVDSSNGFIIENMDAEILAEKIKYLYLNPHILEAMQQKSYERITKEIGFDNYYKVFKSMTHQLMQ